MLKNLFSSISLIFESAKKERKLIFKDDAVVEIYIVFVVLVYFFYTFVYSPEIFTKLPVAFVDNDQTTVSHQVRRMLNDTESLDVAYDASSMLDARKLFEEGKVNGIILIPENFSQKLQKSGGNPSIAIYCDASYMLYYDKTLQAVMNSLGAFTGELQLKQTMMSGVPMKEAIASSKPFNIIANPLYNLEEGYAIFIIPLVLIVALQTLQLTGMGVLYGTLRERNTFLLNFGMAKRTRFGYFFMTIGRSIPYYIISMLMLLLGIEVVFHIFTIPQRGNLFEVLTFLTPVVLSITFLGMSLMNLFRNREDTIMLCTVFSIPALMMGGVSYPIVAFPLWIKVLGFFFPSTIGVKGFLALSQAGASLVEIKDIYMQMWGICIFYFVIAVWTNRRFLYSERLNRPLTNDSIIASALIEVQEITVGFIRTTLSPIKRLVWNYDKTIDSIDTILVDKLQKLNSDRIQTPSTYISGPTLDAIKYTKEHNDLKNLYVNLLANAMDKNNAHEVLPSFIEIIKSFTPDEARLLTLFIANDTLPFVNVIQKENKETAAYSIIEENFVCLKEYGNIQIDYTSNLALYFNNFIRIGLIISPEGFALGRDKYSHLERCDHITELKKQIENSGSTFDLQRRFYKLTPFGKRFVDIVVKNK